MKNSTALLLIAGILFIGVNTSYFWGAWLGFYALLVTLLLVVIFLYLFFAFIICVVGCSKTKERNGKVILSLLSVFIVLVLVIYRPFGLIDFDELKGKDLLVASYEGAGSCNSTLRLKENKNFTFTSVCFGTDRLDGKFDIVNDTIRFSEMPADFKYSFGVYNTTVKHSTAFNQSLPTLKLFKNERDTVGFSFYVFQNKLFN